MWPQLVTLAGPFGHMVAVTREHLDPEIADVRKVQVARGVRRRVENRAQLARVRAERAERAEKVARCRP